MFIISLLKYASVASYCYNFTLKHFAKKTLCCLDCKITSWLSGSDIGRMAGFMPKILKSHQNHFG